MHSATCGLSWLRAETSGSWRSGVRSSSLVQAGADIAGTTAVATQRNRGAQRVSERVSEIAERVLRTDPSSRAVQELSDELNTAARALREAGDNVGKRNQAKRMLDRAAARLAALLRTETQSAVGPLASPEQRRLSGLLTDGLASRAQDASRGVSRPTSNAVPRSPER